MEKFNETDLMKEIKNCTYEQDYETAVKLAEKLELNKMKNVSALCLLGEVFLHEGKLDMAEKALLKAYEKMPKGRRALDLLTEVYIAKESYSEAEYYYKEFISVASRDLHRYILRYRLDKGKGERVSVLIHTLEQLKDYEYIEEWAYELAELYHEAGEDKKSERECDEIILWFGHGEYVDKAIELKQKINGEVPVPKKAPVIEPEETGLEHTDPALQQTVGATYMFDSEGLLERSGLNVALNVEEYMNSDDEYADVYNLEEGGRTETLDEVVTKMDVADTSAEGEDDLAGGDETVLLDQEVIAAKAAEIFSESEEIDEADEVVEEPSAAPVPVGNDDEDEIVQEDIPVPDTVLDIFSTAVDVFGIKKQLAETFTKLESSLLEQEDILVPYDINFVVSGTDESMKTQISIGIAKALNTYGMCDKGKIVRADSSELNNMDFSPVFDKISGGCLIIGSAGLLSDASVKVISDYVNQGDQKVAIVLEDSESDLNGLWRKYPKLRSRFLNVIHISKYDESELVKLAESYAKRRGYEVSQEVRMVTLREIFEKRMHSGEDVNYEDVMAVIDEAVVNLEKRNMKNLFMTVLDNAYKEAKMFTLLPEDFD